MIWRRRSTRRRQQLPRALELGLRELNAGGQSGFEGAADGLELLAALPSLEEILNLRSSPRLSARVAEMIEKSRSGEMTPLDEEEWERYEYLEHFVRIAKAAAHRKTGSFCGRWLISTPRFGNWCDWVPSGLCEYCRIAGRLTLAEHEIDHVIAVNHGG
jgi:hypothetical protein